MKEELYEMVMEIRVMAVMFVLEEDLLWLFCGYAKCKRNKLLQCVKRDLWREQCAEYR